MTIDEAERWSVLITTQGLAVVIVIVAGTLSVVGCRFLYRDAIKPIVVALIAFLRELSAGIRDVKDANREIAVHLNDIKGKMPSICKVKPTGNTPEQKDK